MKECKVEEVYQFFIDRGCTLEEASDILKKCSDLVQLDEQMLEKTVTCMFNADLFYGIIVCNKNDYIYILSDNILKVSNNDEPNYVVENLIDTVNKPYLQKIIGILPEDDLETRLYKMRQSNFNSKGYKVK